MAAESIDGYEHLPDSGNLEFYLVMSALRSKFEKAKEEQLVISGYRMFTIVSGSEERKGHFARIRIAEQSRIRESLQSVSQDDESYFDVALPIEPIEDDGPELSSGEAGDKFLFFRRQSDETETTTLIDASNVNEFLEERQDFLSQSLLYDPIPLRKDTA